MRTKSTAVKPSAVEPGVVVLISEAAMSPRPARTNYLGKEDPFPGWGGVQVVSGGSHTLQLLNGSEASRAEIRSGSGLGSQAKRSSMSFSGSDRSCKPREGCDNCSW